MKLGIISGYHPGIRFDSWVNHKAYADAHGYFYFYNFTPEDEPKGFFFKIQTILRYIDLFDWVFWLDDDAYFTDFSIPLTRLLELADGAEMLICKSPSTKQQFTKFSSGQFFLKSTPKAKEFLKAVMAADLQTIKEFWREDLGLFCFGDQEAMVYLTETDTRFKDGFIKIVDHNYFNNRDFEYQQSLTEHFLVHFTGSEKQESQAMFALRMKANGWLTPPK